MRRIESDGEDITEPVQILYDIAHSSMDWGSGFLDNDEMEAVIGLAVKMKWTVPDLPGNSPAMATVAAKFPEHYEVEVVDIPESVSSSGYHFQAHTRYRVRAKKQGD